MTDPRDFIRDNNIATKDDIPIARPSKLSLQDIKNIKLIPTILQAIRDLAKRKPQNIVGKDGKMGIMGPRGFSGLDGKTPVKGVDYFTREEIENFIQQATPVKGVDYQDGETPDMNLIIDSVLAKIPKPRDGKDGESPRIPIHVGDSEPLDPKPGDIWIKV